MAKCSETQLIYYRNRYANMTVEEKRKLIDHKTAYQKALPPHRRSKIWKQKAKYLREKRPEVYKAKNILREAVRSRKIEKPNKCSICGIKKYLSQIEGHHADYSRPLDVIWCCRKCHLNIHGNQRVRGNQQCNHAAN